MRSDALQRWKQDRGAILDSLEAIHRKITGGKRGRQTATEHLNLALFARLAAEFQGFCRDLHDDAAIHLADSLADEYQARVPILLSALVRERKLDRGNASPGNLGNDFAILGISLWPDIYARYPIKGKKWNTVLEALNEVRNAVGHSTPVLDELHRTHKLTLATFRRWRGLLNSAATGLDRIVAAYLTDLTGESDWY